ncbi:MAG: porin [Maricaulaceae bacterium]
MSRPIFILSAQALAAAICIVTVCGSARADRTVQLGRVDLSGGGSVYTVAGLNEIDAPDRLLWDAELHGEARLVLDNGWTLGAGLQVRAQDDSGRRGFGGLAGDCPAALAECPSVVFDGATVPVAAPASGLFVDGTADSFRTQVQAEDAFVFLRAPWGEVIAGREEGAAALLAARPPATFVLVNADDGAVDPTGLAAVKTDNDLSGPSFKVSYLSPRYLGAQIGVSFTPDLEACGVDACPREINLDNGDPLSPQHNQVVEIVAAFERRWRASLETGVSVGFTRAGEDTGLAPFDRFQAVDAAGYAIWRGFGVSVSHLRSNNGIDGLAATASGDYQATAIEGRYVRGPATFGLGYGFARDDLVGVEADSLHAGVSVTVKNAASFGVGVIRSQQVQPQTAFSGVVLSPESRTAAFIEVGLAF